MTTCFTPIDVYCQLVRHDSSHAMANPPSKVEDNDT